MKIYYFDAETGIYLGEGFADEGFHRARLGGDVERLFDHQRVTSVRRRLPMLLAAMAVPPWIELAASIARWRQAGKLTGVTSRAANPLTTPSRPTA